MYIYIYIYIIESSPIQSKCPLLSPSQYPTFNPSHPHLPQYAQVPALLWVGGVQGEQPRPWLGPSLALE